MPTLQVFDPAMCCPTGVCGPAVDPQLARFSADLDWLRKKGVSVERFSLSQQPAAFAENPVVRRALERDGPGCLPLIVVDGGVVSSASYPVREDLASFVGLKAAPSIFTDAVQELVAIGAAIAANCEPCFRYHYDKARKLDVSKEDMARAVVTAKAVKEAPARSVLELAGRYLAEADVPLEAGSTAAAPVVPEAPVTLGSPKKKGASKCC